MAVHDQAAKFRWPSLRGGMTKQSVLTTVLLPQLVETENPAAPATGLLRLRARRVSL